MKFKKGERILFKTKNSLRSYNKFRRDFIALSGEAADYLAKKDIALVGIDYLSIKKKGDSDHRAHLSLLNKDIPIIRRTFFEKCEMKAGRYFLAALPLALKKTDGGPLRAVLLK